MSEHSIRVTPTDPAFVPDSAPGGRACPRTNRRRRLAGAAHVLILLLALSGCGADEGPPAPNTVATTATSVGASPETGVPVTEVDAVTFAYEITPGPDEGCADFVLASMPQGYLCAGGGRDLGLVSSVVVEEQRLTVLAVPPDASDLLVPSDIRADRNGSWLIVQFPADAQVVVSYRLPQANRECRVDIIPTVCRQAA